MMKVVVKSHCPHHVVFVNVAKFKGTTDTAAPVSRTPTQVRGVALLAPNHKSGKVAGPVDGCAIVVLGGTHFVTLTSAFLRVVLVAFFVIPLCLFILDIKADALSQVGASNVAIRFSGQETAFGSTAHVFLDVPRWCDVQETHAQLSKPIPAKALQCGVVDEDTVVYACIVGRQDGVVNAMTAQS
eukprot:6490840-Amphidinium_carterae.1